MKRGTSQGSGGSAFWNESALDLCGQLTGSISRHREASRELRHAVLLAPGECGRNELDVSRGGRIENGVAECWVRVDHLDLKRVGNEHGQRAFPDEHADCRPPERLVEHGRIVDGAPDDVVLAERCRWRMMDLVGEDNADLVRPCLLGHRCNPPPEAEELATVVRSVVVNGARGAGAVFAQRVLGLLQCGDLIDAAAADAWTAA